MKKYVYTVDSFRIEDIPYGIIREQELNKMGKDGWELVFVEHSTSNTIMFY